MRDDLAQEAVIETWQRQASLRDPERFDAFVRTVARRKRFRLLERIGRRQPAGLEYCLRVAERLPERRLAAEPSLRVDGEWVELSWLRSRLDAAIARLDPLNRELLFRYYSGSSVLELAERHGLTPAGVKARLHRCRRRLQRDLTARVRSARHEQWLAAELRPRPGT